MSCSIMVIGVVVSEGRLSVKMLVKNKTTRAQTAAGDASRAE